MYASDEYGEENQFRYDPIYVCFHQFVSIFVSPPILYIFFGMYSLPEHQYTHISNTKAGSLVRVFLLIFIACNLTSTWAFACASD